MKNFSLFLFLLVSIQSYSQSSIKLITYNIRYANKHDGDDSWDNRKAKVVDILKTNNPDVIGLQEVLKKQLNYLEKNLDQYAYVGVGRDDGKTKGEYSPIFYLKDKYSPISKGWFWLAEDCTKPNKGWDAACNRICTWVALRDSISKEQFLVFNTHLDHKGKQARTNSIAAISDSTIAIALKHIYSNSIANKIYPRIIITGDFNFTPNDTNYTSFTINEDTTSMPDSVAMTRGVRTRGDFSYRALKSRPRQDSYKLAAKPIGTIGTTNAFNLTGPFINRIDYIWVTDFTVESYRVIDDKLPNGHWPSDHFPVMVEVK